MTEKDKREIAEIVRSVIAEQAGTCTLGIKPETAHELISFADTWKTCRRALLGGLIVAAIGGLITALWAGIKTIVK